MGIVLKQSFKNMVSSYAGFGIGAINVLVLYPNFLSQEYFGLITFLLSAGNLLWPVMAFGVHNALIKFYTSYDTAIEQNKLRTMVLILPLFVGFFFGALGSVFYDAILDFFDWNNSLEAPYIWLIYVIAIAIAYFEVFFAWSKIELKSVFGNFMREVFHRLCTMILLVLVFYEVISVNVFIYFVASVYVVRMLVMAIYASRLCFPKFVLEFPRNKWAVLKYAFLMFAVGSVAVLLFDLDKVMIEQYLPIEFVSIYAIAIYMATVVAVPAKAMNQITTPMTASFLNTKNKSGLEDLYKRSSVSLLVIGGLIFLLIVCNVNQLYRLIPEEYHIGASVVLLISLAKLYDNLLGNANGILFNSEHYRVVLSLGILLGIMAFALNVYMIPIFGIYGAAYATFIAFFVNNTMKLIVIRQKFHMHPFTQKSFIVLFVVFLMAAGFYFWEFRWGAIYFWNFNWEPILNILSKSILIGTVYIFLIFRFDISDDISSLMKKMMVTIRENR